MTVSEPLSPARNGEDWCRSEFPLATVTSLTESGAPSASSSRVVGLPDPSAMVAPRGEPERVAEADHRVVAQSPQLADLAQRRALEASPP